MRTFSVRSKKGQKIHITSEATDCVGKTLCGKKCDGWLLAPTEGDELTGVDCVKCLRALIKVRGGLRPLRLKKLRA